MMSLAHRSLVKPVQCVRNGEEVARCTRLDVSAFGMRVSRLGWQPRRPRGHEQGHDGHAAETGRLRDSRSSGVKGLKTGWRALRPSPRHRRSPLFTTDPDALQRMPDHGVGQGRRGPSKPPARRSVTVDQKRAAGKSALEKSTRL